MEYNKTILSVLIFTYNPEDYFIKRVLTSIFSLNSSPNLDIEVLIIDNSSTNGWVSSIKGNELSKFNFELVIEKEQGLTFSRIRGFELAKGDWIVCVDDDNELHPDYLIELQKLVLKHPDVGVWGPGKIHVEYHENAPSWVENYKGVFQEKEFKEIRFGKEHSWKSYYPPGTGMCLNKEVAKAYLEFIRSGKMTATDRKGRSLSSGGDSQVVYSGILIDKAAGVAPELKVNHLIGPAKTNLPYMKKLIFGVFSCWSVHIEVFPEMKTLLVKPKLGKVLIDFFRLFWKSRFGIFAHRLHIPFAKDLARIYSYYQVNNKRLPFIYKTAIQFFKLK